MADIHSIISYTISFFAIYAQIFLLVTFFENRKHIIKHGKESLELSYYPTVTITVPFFNEEKTITGTIESLLALDYPRDRLSIFLIDDGSLDDTWSVVQKFASNPQIKLYKKENGGKHTAMNLGLSMSTAELFGCLDSDSYVHPQALKRIVNIFNNVFIF